MFWIKSVMDVISQASRPVHPVHIPLSWGGILPGDINTMVSSDSNKWVSYFTSEAFQSCI